VSNVVDVPGPAGDAPAPRPPAMMQVVKGVLIALGALYLTTESVAVVLVGAVVAVVLVVLYVVMRHP